MFKASKAFLVRAAALVWMTGVAVLLFKSSRIFMDAAGLGAPGPAVAGAVVVGFVLGLVKGMFMFVPICLKNINRIMALTSPKVWQFYRNRFFVFLLLMVSFGQWAQAAAEGHRFWMLSLAALELSVGTALLFSFKCFLKILPSK